MAQLNQYLHLIIAEKYVAIYFTNGLDPKAKKTACCVCPSELFCDEWLHQKNVKSIHGTLLVMKALNVWHLAHQGFERFTAPLNGLTPF